MNLMRLFSTAARSVTNTELAQLRRRTGFTLVNCRKALQETNNDLVKAEEWLFAEAKRLGWEKAMKLRDRVAPEGLIAIAKSSNKVAMIEVNCETDFVAKTESFVSLAEKVANTCFMHGFAQSVRNTKRMLTTEELKNMETVDKEKLMDSVAKHIGGLGENIVLRRALCFEAEKDIEIYAAAHPSKSIDQGVLTGRFGAFVALQKLSEGKAISDSAKFGADLCLHIIGMHPKRIYAVSEDFEETNNDEESLVHQDFILDPDVTVGELLKENGVQVVDFHLFQCGEYEKYDSEGNDSCKNEGSEKVKNTGEN